MEDATDRAEFATAFGVDARWSVGPTTVRGIFDAAYADPLGALESAMPVFQCPTDDLPGSFAQGQTLTIDSTAYTIVEVMPDGTGWVVLRLRG